MSRLARSLVVAALLPACVESRSVVTWDEAVPAEVRRENAATAPTTKPPVVADAPRSRRPDDAFGGGRAHASITPAGLQIDRAISDFRARRAASRNLKRTHPVHAETWLEVLSAIDDACGVAPTADDLGAFVRARVTLEVEHQTDLEKRVVLPPDIDARVSATLGHIDGRVAELKLILPDGGGIVTPPRRHRDGVLVLHTPVSSPVVSSPFGLRVDPIAGGARFHAGLDFAQPQGSMVYAAADGFVVYAGWQGGYGRHVVIDHGDGVRTHYSHLDQIFTSAGQRVEVGDTVGAVGATGRATGPHLHFAVTNHEGQFLDPEYVLDNAMAFTDGSDAPVRVATTRKAKPKSRAAQRARRASK